MPAAENTDDALCIALPDTHPFQDVEASLISKCHIPELNCSAAELQVRGAWGINHLASSVQQLQQILHVYHVLLNHPVICAKKVEWSIQLRHQGQKQDCVANSQGALVAEAGQSKSSTNSSDSS
eukprot:GHRR01033301.1.p2 GENE.GHRR01033301.1~~GHRR01033301.1.p2  ORF type:complete len:124 (-),score=33.84 GHRR01033301.1:244-615(-)